MGWLCPSTSTQAAIFVPGEIEQDDYGALLSMANQEERDILSQYTITYFTEPLGEARNVWGYARPYRKEIGLYMGSLSPYTAQEIFFHELGHAAEVYQTQTDCADDVFYCGEVPNLPSQLSETYAEQYAATRLQELCL